MSQDGDQIDWASVLEFHRQIVRQGERQFFSLEVGDASNRWTPLNGEADWTHQGPWSINSELVNPGFARDFEDLGPDFFLGCGCVLEGNGNQTVTPLIYMEVTLSGFGDATDPTITPGSSKWTLGPGLFTRLEKAHVHLEGDAEVLATALIENAKKLLEKGVHDFSKAIREAVAAKFSHVDLDLRSAEWGWCVFTAPASVSTFNVHLERDYNLTTGCILKGKGDGGLESLESVGAQVDEPALTPRPFVPLNDSQLLAVERILGTSRVSTISGPPGCGKSQVVVAALLNAWSHGLKTLFASTNNSAVDVVLERLRRFEDEFPVVVRAGSRTHSRVLPSLEIALTTLEDTHAASDERAAQGRIDTLQAQRQLLLSLEQEGLYTRIDELLKAAQSAYGKAKAINADEDAVLADLTEEMGELFGDTATPQEAAHLVGQAREWWDQRSALQNQIQEDTIARQDLTQKREVFALDRQRACSEIGVETEGEERWQWLASDRGPRAIQSWWAGLEKTLDSISREHLLNFPWLKAYDEFRSSRDAASRIDESRGVSTRLRELHANWQTSLKELEGAREVASEWRAELAGRGFPPGTQVDFDSADYWLSEYRKHEPLASSGARHLPFTKARKASKAMSAAFQHIRESIPASIWAQVSGDGRGRSEAFVPIAECIARGRALQRAVSAAEAKHEDLRSALNSVRTQAARVGARGLSEDSLSEWLEQADELDSAIERWVAAKEAWEKREAQQNAMDALRSAVAGFFTIERSHPIKVGFAENRGRALVDALKACAEDPTEQSLDALMLVRHQGLAQELVEAWSEILALHREVQDFDAERDRIATPTARIQEWWKSRPSCVQGPEPLQIPDEQSELLADIRLRERWEASWDEFSRVTQPQLQADGAHEQARAAAKIQEAVAAVPEPQREAIGSITERAVAREDSWDLEELQGAFRAFSPEGLKAGIRRIDRDLERLAFTQAKARWVQRVSADAEAMDALRELRQAYRGNLRLPPGKAKAFEAALRALPVWVVTGQSAQSIPVSPEAFDLLIIDEASTCTLTNVLPLIYRAKRIVVIGDNQQLPAIPLLRSRGQEEILLSNLGLKNLDPELRHVDTNLYQCSVSRLRGRESEVVSLLEHYRSHPLIIGFSNRNIYHSRLQLKRRAGLLEADLHGIFYRDVRGASTRRSGSWINHEEADAVVACIQEIRSKSPSSTIGVVTPFRAQVELLEQQLKTAGVPNVHVGTAHRFQGDERDIVVFSPVVADGLPTGTQAWVADEKLVNVAVTRARDAFFMVADMEACQEAGAILKKLTEHCFQAKVVRDQNSKAETRLFAELILAGLNAVTPQANIGDSAVDFLVQGRVRSLVIEVDGQEAHANRKAADEARDAFLMSQGHEVLRVSARDVLETTASVMVKIQEALSDVRETI